MRLVRYEHAEGTFVGLLDGEKVGRVDLEPLGAAPDDLLAVVRAWEDGGSSVVGSGEPGPALDDVRLLAPFPNPPHNVLCVGKNYREHADEFAGSGFDATGGGDVTPKHPIVFTKPSTSIIGPGDTIDPHVAVTSALDYEAEIAVVVGRGGRDIASADAWQHVWGYTLVNDITARDLQRRHKQWFLGKSLDTFCPMGPWAVTADEVKGRNLIVESHVNGQLRQRASTRDLIFDIPSLIHTLSAGRSLQAGDIIATGTPAGVGIGFDPPRFLEAGDEVSVRATGLGTLTNTVATT